MRHLLNKKIELIYEDYCIDEMWEVSLQPLVTELMTRDPHFDLQYDYEEESAEVPLCRIDYHAPKHKFRKAGFSKVRFCAAKANVRFKANVDVWNNE